VEIDSMKCVASANFCNSIKEAKELIKTKYGVNVDDLD